MAEATLKYDGGFSPVMGKIPARKVITPTLKPVYK
jgi:hypothetical protein